MDAASSEGPSLKSLDALILGNRHARYEGDIFSVAKLCPFVLRAPEFAEADGAIDVTKDFQGYHADDSFADRFWQMNYRADQLDQKLKPEMVLFDVKSAIGRYAEDHGYLTSERQRCRVAFYLCICAVDPCFVELIPNFFQKPSSASRYTPNDSEEHESNDDKAVNSSRKSRLHPNAYRLSPCNSPYRMPLALLPEALKRVREGIRQQTPYINPWTLVAFPEWKPATTTSSESLKPMEDSGHFSAYKAMMEIYRLVRKWGNPSISIDFVGLQPRLADFKLLLGLRRQRRRQVFIQHKLDAILRSSNASLDKVGIARGQAKQQRWYCTAFERCVNTACHMTLSSMLIDPRFDFLFYQFEFSEGYNRRPRMECFFLPERVLPDSFYTTLANYESFERDEFRPYRFVMDYAGQWVNKMLAIVHTNPEPRQVRPRPLRSALSFNLGDTSKAAAKTQKSGEILDRTIRTYHRSGRHRYMEVLERRHQQFFRSMLRMCALK